jgi:hypothetical protein
MTVKHLIYFSFEIGSSTNLLNYPCRLSAAKSKKVINKRMEQLLQQ